MKSLVATALLATLAVAFPYNLDQLVPPLARDAKFMKLKAEMIGGQTTGAAVFHIGQVIHRTDPPQGPGALPLTPPSFDAEAQYVSNQGVHVFVAPKAGDDRGECPGLNVLANHGYLPHNGRATIAQFIQATTTVFGMAPDLATFLATFGAIFDGDGLSWSIGGMPHTGILGSHGHYETDSSPFKSDLNQYGRNDEFIMSQFYDLYNRQPIAATANYNLQVLRDFRRDRLYDSINKNPYFTYNAFAGLFVSQAAYTFIYRFMSNKSAEYPEGILNKATLKSFMSVHGTDEDSLTHIPGFEAIPDNWYKRSIAAEYSIPYFMADVAYIASAIPQVLQLGCNLGQVETYNQVSPQLISSGTYTSQQFLANPICFAIEFAIAEVPLITGLGLNLGILGSLVGKLESLTASLNCPSIGSVNQSAFALCPGSSVYGGPTGPIAPGAIQS